MSTTVRFTEDLTRIEHVPRGAWFVWAGSLYIKFSNKSEPGPGSEVMRVEDQEIVTFSFEAEVCKVKVSEVVIAGPRW